jgi:hypothetical protein
MCPVRIKAKMQNVQLQIYEKNEQVSLLKHSCAQLTR